MVSMGGSAGLRVVVDYIDDPIRGFAAVERIVDRGGDARIGDAHFAQAKQIHASADRFHAWNVWRCRPH